MAGRIDPRWAWQPYEPGAENPWDLKKVGHLLRRASFGATWEEMEAALDHEGPVYLRLSMMYGAPAPDESP